MSKKKVKRSKNRDNFKILIFINCVQTVLILILVIHIWGIGNNAQIKKSNSKTIDTKSNIKGENYVLLGDSITDWYPISDFFDEDTTIINSGFAG